MPSAYLGLGSDIGNRTVWLRTGVDRLAAAGLTVGRISSLYLTEPVGDPTLPWFVNGVVEILEPPAPAALLATCLAVERSCGRRRTGAGLEARSLDVDILLYDRERIVESGLSIPHPRLHERRFALEPLAEIAGNEVHPVTGESIAGHLANLEGKERVWLLAPFPGANGPV